MKNIKDDMKAKRVYEAVTWKGSGRVAALLTAGMMAGCTHHGARRQKLDARLAEESRALTTAVVDVLHRQPAGERDVYAATAMMFAEQDQRVEGLPTQPFDVPGLLASVGVTNGVAAMEAVEKGDAGRAVVEVRERFGKQDEWRAAAAKEELALVEMGVAAEAARNRRVAGWSWFSAGAVGLLGGAVALFVFCPMAIPLAGRTLGWLVGKLPGLASACGVVSVKAFDAVVRGIEKTKRQGWPGAPTVPVANSNLAGGDSRRGPAADWVAQLEAALGREMDAAHKELVRARKAKIA